MLLMRKLISFFFCTFSCLLAFTHTTFAQEQNAWSYELITFPDGETKEHYVYYDPYKEWLYFEDKAGEVRYFLADDVISFEYRGSRYYSLPFKNGNLSFFKVEFEGEKTALLSKMNSVNLIQYIADSYDKYYTICYEAYGIKGIHLCQVNYSVGSLNKLPGPYPQGVYQPILERTLKPVSISSSLFIVGEEGLELFQLDVTKKVFMSLFTKKENYKFKSLKVLYGQEIYRKMQTYAFKNKLKEDQLEDLKEIVRYCDTI